MRTHGAKLAAHWIVYKHLIFHEWNKWKNEMKGDVGMSSHEKEKEQDA